MITPKKYTTEEIRKGVNTFTTEEVREMEESYPEDFMTFLCEAIVWTERVKGRNI